MEEKRRLLSWAYHYSQKNPPPSSQSRFPASPEWPWGSLALAISRLQQFLRTGCGAPKSAIRPRDGCPGRPGRTWLLWGWRRKWGSYPVNDKPLHPRRLIFILYFKESLKIDVGLLGHGFPKWNLVSWVDRIGWCMLDSWFSLGSC